MPHHYTAPNERRRAHRFAVGHDAHLFVRGRAAAGVDAADRPLVYSGVTRDFSSSGLLVEVLSPAAEPADFPPGADVDVALDLHGSGVVEMAKHWWLGIGLFGSSNANCVSIQRSAIES